MTSRRDFIAALGALTVGSVAGCSSDSGGTATPTETAMPTEPITPTGTPTETPTDTDAESPSETHTVELTSNRVFDPNSLEIQVGDTIIFENVSDLEHTVTAYEDELPEDADYWASGGFDSEQAARDAHSTSGGLEANGKVDSGATWTHTFETEGTHEYFCIPHEAAYMVGEIGVGVTPGDRHSVSVGAFGNLVFDPESLTISPGTTVTFEWESDNHNVVPESQPSGANWEGEGEQGITFDQGHSYSHTFETEGTYEYVCTPHEAAGMVGEIVVATET